MTETQTQSGATATVYPDNIQQIGDQIAKLTLKQTVDLREYLKEQGIEAPDFGAMVSTDGGMPGTPINVEPEKTTFDVFLKSVGEKKINVIKEIRTLTGLGLKEAKEFVEAVGGGKPIRDNVTKEEAEKVKATIEAAGGTVEIK